MFLTLAGDFGGKFLVRVLRHSAYRWNKNRDSNPQRQFSWNKLKTIIFSRSLDVASRIDGRLSEICFPVLLSLIFL